MPINISKSLIAKLPKSEQKGIERALKSKSNNKCFLCEAKFNYASESIIADHDIPEVDDGPTEQKNLNLAHSKCNSMKRSNKSVEVRPYLKLQAFLASKNYLVKYGDTLEHFKIEPKSSHVEISDSKVEFQLPDNTVQTVAIFEESNEKSKFKYCFVEVPRNALINDDDVQPRNIKQNQIWALYTDIQVNPLHEPPSCRLIQDSKSASDMYKLALFDGQHKTVASWMNDRKKIVVKVYFDLTQDQANYLVNSIQAKIKKLPLSPFELSAKLADEWKSRLEDYQLAISDPKLMSEAGFIDWLPNAERKRALTAFEAALIQNLVDQDNFAFNKYVKWAGRPLTATTLITESVLKTKILKPLLLTKPLEEPVTTGEKTRDREMRNIIFALETLVELAFDDENQPFSDKQIERRKRMVYQASLLKISDLIRGVYGNVLVNDPNKEMSQRDLDEKQKDRIRNAIRNIVEHPVWWSDYSISPKMQAVEESLTKNQNYDRAFDNVGLRLGYAVDVDPLASDWHE